MRQTMAVKMYPVAQAQHTVEIPLNAWKGVGASY